jgi:hypothetical protein
MTPENRARLWRWVRPWWSLAAGLVLYGIVRWLFVHATGSRGLLTPGQPFDRWLAGLALAALVLRVTVLVAVPAVIAYRVAEALLRRLVERSRRLRTAPPRDETLDTAQPPP